MEPGLLARQRQNLGMELDKHLAPRKIMEIRQATPEEVPLLALLFNNYRVFYGKPPDIGAAAQFLNDRLTRHESEIFVVVAGDTIAGFMQLYPLFSSTRMKKLWLLNDLFVSKEYRGRGFSKVLIEQAKELCRQTGACGFTLETGKGNAIGNQLYPKMGMRLSDGYNAYGWEA